MGLYNKNCNALRRRHPELHDAYQDWLDSRHGAEESLVVELLQARDGNEVIAATKEGKKIRLNSPYAPAKEAERWVQQFDFTRSATHVFMFGMGNGMFVSQLLREQKEDGILFLVEPNIYLFDRLLHLIDLSDILESSRVYLTVGGLGGYQWVQVRNDHMHWMNEKHCIVCHHTGYERLYPAEYEKFCIAMSQFRNKIQANKATQVHFGKSSVVNTIKNLTYIKEARSISEYQGMLRGETPVIIVSAGPSLDKNIDTLKAAKGHALILAVDTAVRTMLAHEIIPDAIVTLDADKPTSYLTLPQIAQLPLFCCMEANAEIMEYHQGLKIWFKPGLLLNDYAKRFDKSFPPYETGGSVATAAFEIARILGADTVILVGQDLAYAGEVTHAGGMISAILGEENNTRMVPGINGEMVRTRGDWYRYLQWFETAVARCQGMIRVIDATEGGAFISGTEIMTLQDAVQQYCKETVWPADTLQAQEAMFSEEEYAVLRQEMQRYSGEMQELQSVAGQASTICNKICNSGQLDPALLAACRQQLLQYNAGMQEKMIYPVVDVYISDATAAYVEAEDHLTASEKADFRLPFVRSKKVYDAIIQATKQLLPIASEYSGK